MLGLVVYFSHLPNAFRKAWLVAITQPLLRTQLEPALDKVLTLQPGGERALAQRHPSGR